MSLSKAIALALLGLALGGAPAPAGPPPSPGVPAAIESPSPGTTLRRAQQSEWILGDLESARSLYESLASTQGEVGQEARLGLARTFRKLGRLEEARARLASAEASGVPQRLRAQVLAERARLDATRSVSGPMEVTSDSSRSLSTGTVRIEVGSGEGPSRTVAKARVTMRVRGPAGPSGPAVVSLEVQDACLGDVARSLASRARVDVLVTPSIANQRVSVSVKEVPPLQALDHLARAAGAKLTTWNGTWTLATLGELSRLRLEPGQEPTKPALAQAVLVALKIYGPDEKGVVKLLASPRVMTVDGTTARVTVGRRSTAGAPEDAKTDARSVDYNVEVTPTTVKGTDQIHLDLDVDLSSSEKDGARVRVRQRRQKVKLRIKDGEPFKFDLASGEPTPRSVEVQAFRVK